MNLFYTTDISGDIARLNEEESIHALRVLRLQARDKINFVDGKGQFFEGHIIKSEPKQCLIQIDKRQSASPHPYYLHILIAPTKNIERFEWFLEKATEIGISEITPIICEHSERRQTKTERLQKVLVSAMKQSLKAYLPKLNELKKFHDVINSITVEEKYICSGGAEHSLKKVHGKKQSIAVLIGPEGDFSEEELNEAKRNNFIPVSLCESRLRTETAGVMAAAIINIRNQ